MTDAELLADRALARQLTRSWDAFFARFGRLTNVQRAAIPDILGGRSVLVSAPTAAGKTEAACAPLMERMLRLPGDWRVIYVSPTRALVNDLFERLRNPLERLNVRLARRTGEYRSGAEEAQVLLTTPESLDSMLCRGRIEGGHLLAASEAVVLDEIHLLASSARGEQVRWLLARLRRLRRFAKQEGWVQEDGVQVVALSATVPDLAEVQRRFVQDGRVIQVAGGRTIEEIELDGGPFETETAVPVYLTAGKSPEKILIFCHARRRVDRLAQHLAESLAPLGYLVRAHHGSLAQSARETAEDEVRRERKIVLVATSTLEIGVDIGDIDLVVLDSPARDIASLLQRLGRGNRRSGKTRVLVCGATVAELSVPRWPSRRLE